MMPYRHKYEENKIFTKLGRLVTFALRYLPSAETKQNYPIYNRQAFTVSILRPLHQVYEEMLNYMNKHVYLTRMVPKKGGCKEVGGVLGVWVLGVYGEIKWI